MSKFKPVSVSLCCNDGNGTRTGRIEAVHIGSEELLQLEGDFMGDGPEILSYHFEVTQSGGFGCGYAKGFIRIAEKDFPIHGYKSHWGNLCWDCVIMTAQTTIELINHLKSLDLFSCAVGDREFFELWDKPGALFTEAQIPALEEWGYQAP